jgi:hypothetical protein
VKFHTEFLISITVPRPEYDPDAFICHSFGNIEDFAKAQSALEFIDSIGHHPPHENAFDLVEMGEKSVDDALIDCMCDFSAEIAPERSEFPPGV